MAGQSSDSGANRFLILLESPVVFSSLENWNFILDSSKDLQKKKHAGTLDAATDLMYGAKVIQKPTIREQLPEMHQTFYRNEIQKFQNMPESEKIPEKNPDYKFNNTKLFSELVRFLRNVTQHAEERMEEHDFKYFFPEGYQNKQIFIQYIVDRLPTMLLYSWCKDKNIKFSPKFTLSLWRGLEAYLKDNFLCRIRWNRKEETDESHQCVWNVVKCTADVYDRLYGTTLIITEGNGKALLEVKRDYLYKDTLTYNFEGPKIPASYSIVFGAHKLKPSPDNETDTSEVNNSNAQKSEAVKSKVGKSKGSKSKPDKSTAPKLKAYQLGTIYIFVKNTNLHEVITQLEVQRNPDMTPNIETKLNKQTEDIKDILRDHIIETGKIEIDGNVIALSSIRQFAEDTLKKLQFHEWRMLLLNEPLRLFRKAWINEILVPKCNNEQSTTSLEDIRDLNSKVELVGSPWRKLKPLKNLHYKLGKSRMISLFIPYEDSKSEETETIKRSICNSTVENEIFEQAFLKHFHMHSYENKRTKKSKKHKIDDNRDSSPGSHVHLRKRQEK